jgi:hypothetical protein
MSDGCTDMMREERARQKGGDGCIKSPLLTELYIEMLQVQKDVKELKSILNTITEKGEVNHGQTC